MTSTNQNLSNYTVVQLRFLLKENGLPSSGNKKDLIERLKFHIDNNNNNDEVKVIKDPAKAVPRVNNGKVCKYRKVEDVGSMTVAELKMKLRDLGAALKGKKKDLIDRLVYYENNNNFVTKAPTSLLTSDAVPLPNRLITPNEEAYKDINSNTSLPPLTKKNILHYLNRFSMSIESGKKMYENQFLMSARMAMDGDIHFFNGRCKASMKKATCYIVDIQISSSGSVDCCQCDCGVGEPPNAHCKHVVALLLAVEEMKRAGQIILNVTCTQELQSFHKPSKQYFGTPLKAQDLPRGKYNQSQEINFFPVDPALINTDKYNEELRNLCIAFAANNSTTMPLMQTLVPANPYAIAWDHNYTATDPAEEILRSLKVLDVSDSEIEQIEISTRDQAESANWWDFRRHHLTASNFYSCCKCVSEEAKNNLAQRILHPTSFSSKHTQHGKDCEPRAIKKYESNGVTVKKCGLFLMKGNECLGATPDGLIGDETILEVKGPYNQRKAKINETSIPYLLKDPSSGKLCLDPQHQYYFQIQGQLMVTGRKYANLLVYTFVDMMVIDVPRNNSFIADMKNQLMNFYHQYFQPALLEKYQFKNYGKVFKLKTD